MCYVLPMIHDINIFHTITSCLLFQKIFIDYTGCPCFNNFIIAFLHLDISIVCRYFVHFKLFKRSVAFHISPRNWFLFFILEFRDGWEKSLSLSSTFSINCSTLGKLLQTKQQTKLIFPEINTLK